MKAIEQKKLAIIKSNAAPEVKLKALEKLEEKQNAGTKADYKKAGQMLRQASNLIGNAVGLVPSFSIELKKLEKEIEDVRFSLEHYHDRIW